MKRPCPFSIRVFPPLALAAITFAIGCRPPEGATDTPGHAHDHAGESAEAQHAHEEPGFQLTAHGSGFEIFVDHEPAELGHAAAYAAHVTDLASGRPWSDSPLTLRLQGPGGERSEATAVKPASPGIYVIELETPTAGALSLEAEFQLEGVTRKLNLGVVSGFASHEAAHAAAGKLASAEGFPMAKERQWELPIKTVEAARRTMIPSLIAPAEVHPASGRRAMAVAPVKGRLVPVPGSTLPVVGSVVKRGQALAWIQPLFSDATARLAEARAATQRTGIQLEDTRKTFERIRGLARQEAKSQRELQEAETALRLAEASHNAARELERAYTVAAADMLNGGSDASPTFALLSPINGVIARHADRAAGELIAEAEVVYTILDRSRALLHGLIPENTPLFADQLTQVACVTGGPNGVRFNVLDGDHGALLAIGGEVDPRTRSYSVHIETANPEGRLRIGQRVTLEISHGESRNAVAVPESALIEEDGRQAVYAQVSGEMFVKRSVRTGVRSGNWIEIVRGVTEGERIVVEGAYAVRLAALGGGAIPHGHHH